MDTKYGFVWDNIELTRLCQYKGSRWINIKHKNGNEYTIQLSPKLKKIHVEKIKKGNVSK